MILILGHPKEDHSALIAEKIKAQGQSVFFLDTRRYPTELSLSYSVEQKGQGLLKDKQSGQNIAFSDIQSAYWRLHMGVAIQSLKTPDHLSSFAFREIENSMRIALKSLDCFWVNPPSAIEDHHHKAHQLHILKTTGLRVPKTLVSNDYESVKHFFEAMNGQVIYKPLIKGYYTTRLTPDILVPEQFHRMFPIPAQFQEYIPGTDLMVYRIDKHLYTAEVKTESLDFRSDQAARRKPITLPNTVQSDCFKLANALKQVFSLIDIRRTPDGEYVFIEGNPSPRYIEFESETGYPISDTLVELLLSQQR